MKKIIIYIGILVAGLLLGYYFFGHEPTAEIQAEGGEHSEEVDHMWTCSMHPQIMQPDPGDCPICGMDLIPAEAGTGALAPDQFTMSEEAMALANIRTLTVGEGGAREGKLTLSGTIRINEEVNAVEVAHFDGRIETLHINFTGEKVRRGELLATMYSPDLVAAQQELLTAAKMKEDQPALYQAVRNKLKLWKLSEEQISAIEASGKVRRNFPVHATVGGTVTEKKVQEGDYVNQGQALFEIADLDRVWAVFDAYERQIRNLEEGQEILITTNAYPDRFFDATISFIDPLLDSSRRTVQVRAVIQNKDHNLKPGMFVSGVVDTDAALEEESLITVPKSAVMWTGERSLVYVKPDPDLPIFEMREVTLGSNVGEYYQILDGLQDGEEVVVNGTFTVDAAAQLRGKNSMMNRASNTDGRSEKEVLVSLALQNEYKAVLKTYLEIKDALVLGKAALVGEQAKEMLDQLTSIAGDSEAGEAGIPDTVIEAVKAMAENHLVEQQRDHFVVLSNYLISISSNVESLEKMLYVQHCPMANGDEGASWLSLSNEVQNPYMGEVMLNCGEVIKTIK